MMRKFSKTMPLLLLSVAFGCSDKDTFLDPDCRTCFTYAIAFQTSGTGQELRDVNFTDTDHGWAVGDGGVVVHTADGGETWNRQDSGQTSILYAVHFNDAATGWAAGLTGKLLFTTDGGASWGSTIITPRTLTDVYFADNIRGWAAGDSIILHTYQVQPQWIEYQDDQVTIPIIYAMSFPTALNGWAVGLEGTILHTADGGLHWTPQASGSGQPILDVCFIDASTGWAVGVGGMILYTEDGGLTWTEQSSPTDKVLHGVGFWNSEKGLAVGDEGIILTTEDGGSNWTTLASGTTNTLRKVSCPATDTSWVCGQYGQILKVSLTEGTCCD